MTTQTLDDLLDEFETCAYQSCFSMCDELRVKIKEALAQPEQEPDVYIPADALRQLKGTSLLILRSVPLYGYRGDGLIPLYTTQPQRKPLTDEQIVAIYGNDMMNYRDGDYMRFARAIEAAHGIKE